MPDAADMADRHRANLTELAELGMTLARGLHGRAMAASDEKAAADLALAFHRISRSVRQTMALEARLERDCRLADREAAEGARREKLTRVQRKRRHVQAAAERLIWTEVEGDEAAEDLADELTGLVFSLSEQDDFLDLPIETCVARLREDLGLPAPDLDGDDAAPPDGEPLEVVIWRSTA